MVETLDESVGRIVAKIEALGLAERTIFIFMVGQRRAATCWNRRTLPRRTTVPYRAGKGFLYEGGVRVPMIVRWDTQIRAGPDDRRTGHQHRLDADLARRRGSETGGRIRRPSVCST